MHYKFFGDEQAVTDTPTDSACREGRTAASEPFDPDDPSPTTPNGGMMPLPVLNSDDAWDPCDELSPEEWPGATDDWDENLAPRRRPTLSEPPLEDDGWFDAVVQEGDPAIRPWWIDDTSDNPFDHPEEEVFPKQSDPLLAEVSPKKKPPTSASRRGRCTGGRDSPPFKASSGRKDLLVGHGTS